MDGSNGSSVKACDMKLMAFVFSVGQPVFQRLPFLFKMTIIFNGQH